MIKVPSSVADWKLPNLYNGRKMASQGNMSPGEGRRPPVVRPDFSWQLILSCRLVRFVYRGGGGRGEKDSFSPGE